jgi:cytochrome c oxidase subunit IV
MSERQANDHRPTVWELARGTAVVWIVLMVLLAVSAGSAYVPLGPANAAINLGIAAVMIVILAAYLMNLRGSTALVRLFAASGLFWLIFMFVLTFTDYLSRS